MGVSIPKTLASDGRKFWRDVTTAYDLRADELRTLESACRSLDMVTAITAQWEALGRPFTTTGSMGQLVEHPLLGTLDRAQKAFELFVKRLALPDVDGAKPNQQRDAVMTRWVNAHGRAA